MAQYNFANPFAEAFKMFGENSAINKMMSAQRSNAQIMSTVGQIVTENIQNVIKCNGEMLHSGANGFMHLVQEVSSSPEMAANKTISFAKHSVESANSNTREIIDVAMKSGMEVFDMISRKMSENLQDYTATSSAEKKKAQA